jgi:hypothetical protein
MERDTILACSGDAVVIGPVREAGIIECIFDGSGGDGAAVGVDHHPREADFGAENVRVLKSVFTNNRGVGLVLRDTSAISHGVHRVDSCAFVGNGEAGAELDCADWVAERCVSFSNAGDGFAVNTPVPGWPARLVSNTSAFNQGDGFRLTGPAYSGDSLQLVQHNLAALNAGAGFRVPPQSFGSFAFNDAWSNYLGQYVGAWGSADSNLTVDPRFCDLGAGNLGLQQGSPAGAGGVYGLIGALPEQCPNTTAVEPTTQRLSFAVRPSVARGSVEFVPPTIGTDGRVEIFDVTGRRHWGAAFGPTTGALRWTGQSEHGRAQPGLYWVRFSRAGETHSQRLVWLR